MGHPRLKEAVRLLSSLIEVPSFSRQEDGTADIWFEWLVSQGVKGVNRLHNNIYAFSDNFNPEKPILMLNSHHDTVKPVASYTRNPFTATIENDRLYGLGSNDAGASCVALASVFLDLKDNGNLPFNLLLAITAEEEVSGEKGIRALLAHLKQTARMPEMAIVGEPTDMQPATAERGLLVFDCEAMGKAGHAARYEGINAIYRALEDIERLKNFREPVISETLGPIKVSVTMIEAGTQHNAVPDKCSFVADVRTTDAYTNDETVELLRNSVKWSRLTPRSTRIHASVIPQNHPLVRSAEELGRMPFISPTTSDMALMPTVASLKIGPGQSSRSHSADEYVKVSEIDQALSLYTNIILNLTK